jgi:hypothetical protein
LAKVQGALSVPYSGWKETHSRKVDNGGPVLSFEGQGVPSYRHSWIIGGIFDGIHWSTEPITPLLEAYWNVVSLRIWLSEW